MKDFTLRPVDNIDKVLAVDFEFVSDRKCDIYYKIPPTGPAQPVHTFLKDHVYINQHESKTKGKTGAIPKAKTRTTVPPPLPERNGIKTIDVKKRNKEIKSQENKNIVKQKTKSIDFDHIYQNIFKVAKKPLIKNNPIYFPWRRKPKKESQPEKDADPQAKPQSAEEKPQPDRETQPPEKEPSYSGSDRNSPPPSYEAAHQCQQEINMNIGTNMTPSGNPIRKSTLLELEPDVISGLVDLNLSSSGSSSNATTTTSDDLFDEQIVANVSYVRSPPRSEEERLRLSISTKQPSQPNPYQIVPRPKIKPIPQQNNTHYLMSCTTSTKTYSSNSQSNQSKNTTTNINLSSKLHYVTPGCISNNNYESKIELNTDKTDSEMKVSKEHSTDKVRVTKIPPTVSYQMNEWRKKKQWERKTRQMKNIKLTEADEIPDIVLIHASDGISWVDYFRQVFFSYNTHTEKFRLIEKNIEELEQPIVPPVLAEQISLSKLQLVVLSPKFLRHMEKYPELEIGDFFTSNRVISILLGVNHSSISKEHRAVLYTYEEWSHHKASHSDIDFVNKVLSECWTILGTYHVPHYTAITPMFKVTPRKINQLHRRVHLLLTKSLEHVPKSDIKVFLTDVNRKKRHDFLQWKLLNPYNIIFDMPEMYMTSSCCIDIELWVQEESYGAREVKCETSLDQLTRLLQQTSNPLEIMCQSLSLSPLTNDLDNFLTSALSRNMPSYNLNEEHIRNHQLFNYSSSSKLPTWLHFSAQYGLHSLTWKLLDLPGGERALNVQNSDGKTPSYLALSAGYRKLAQDLENIETVSMSRNSESGFDEESLTRPRSKESSLQADHNLWSRQPTLPIGQPLVTSSPNPNPTIDHEKDYLNMSHLDQDDIGLNLTPSTQMNTSGNEYHPEPTKSRSVTDF